MIIFTFEVLSISFSWQKPHPNFLATFAPDNTSIAPYVMSITSITNYVYDILIES